MTMLDADLRFLYYVFFVLPVRSLIKRRVVLTPEFSNIRLSRMLNMCGTVVYTIIFLKVKAEFDTYTN